MYMYSRMYCSSEPVVVTNFSNVCARKANEVLAALTNSFVPQVRRSERLRRGFISGHWNPDETSVSAVPRVNENRVGQNKTRF